jgi:hypothetical protein
LGFPGLQLIAFVAYEHGHICIEIQEKSACFFVVFLVWLCHWYDTYAFHGPGGMA